MSQINPFIGSILQTPNAQRQAANDQDRQLRRSTDSTRNAYLVGDRIELTVESSDAAEQTGDQKKEQQARDPREEKDDESAGDEEQEHLPRLDISA